MFENLINQVSPPSEDILSDWRNWPALPLTMPKPSISGHRPFMSIFPISKERK